MKSSKKFGKKDGLKSNSGSTSESTVSTNSSEGKNDVIQDRCTRDLDVEDQYFLWWAEKCLSKQRIDELLEQVTKLDEECNEIQLKTEKNYECRSTIEQLIETNVLLDQVLVTQLDPLVDLKLFVELNTKISHLVDKMNVCSVELRNMIKIENQEEVAEHLKLLAEFETDLVELEQFSCMFKQLTETLSTIQSNKSQIKQSREKLSQLMNETSSVLCQYLILTKTTESNVV